jgi:hypothetical protein
MTKIAIVTGSSRGLGKSTALNLAKKGIDTIVTYHSNGLVPKPLPYNWILQTLKLSTVSRKKFSTHSNLNGRQIGLISW